MPMRTASGGNSSSAHQPKAFVAIDQRDIMERPRADG
jgi:hypothetical protein